jgi:hypothetical protein
VDAGVIQDRIDACLVAMDHVEHAVRKPRLLQHLGHADRGRRILLRRLEDERVAAGERHWEHPERHHHREVERRDPSADANRLAHRVRVDLRADVLRMLALQEVRDSAGEFDDFHAALDRAHRVGDGLAVLFADETRKVLLVFLERAQEPLHHARAADRRPVAPLGKSRTRCLDRAIDECRIAERDSAHDLAGRGVVDVAHSRRGRRNRISVDPQRNRFELQVDRLVHERNSGEGDYILTPADKIGSLQ